jgi:hypothetical protein
MGEVRRKYQRINPQYSPTNNPWKIPDWRKKSNYLNPQDMSRDLWRWEFLRRQKQYREDWNRYAQWLSERDEAAHYLAARYKVPWLVHPGEQHPSDYPQNPQVEKELPIELERGMLLFPDPECVGKTLSVPDSDEYKDFHWLDGEDAGEIFETTNLNLWDVEEHWGLQYTLFPQEVVLRFDLRTTEVEQLCRLAIEAFPQVKFSPPDPQQTDSPHPTSRKCTTAPGQTVPELGWKIGLQELPAWKGPRTAPRLILDPTTTGIVHVIFDLMQPKLFQWESAKHWLTKIQAEQVGDIPKKNADPYTWLKYLRILDACDFNPDPQDFALTDMTYEKIGQMILGITKNTEENKARARAKQDHTKAQQLLVYFPY